MDSDFLPTDFVNCTGLRMCLANGGAPLRWVQNTNAPVDAKNHVYEFALEVNIPLLKDVPLGCEDVSTNLAGRCTKYSTFDAVRVLEGRTRLARHRFDPLPRHALAGHPRAEPQRFVSSRPASPRPDSPTGSPAATTGQRLVTRGNPDLTPEKAKTFTVGMVLDADLHSALQLVGRLLRTPS